MLALWLLQRRTGDAGVADVGWALGVGLLSAVVLLDAGGPVTRRLAVAALVGAWSLRLGTHLLVDRVLSPGEDGRYQTLREKWGDRAQGKLLVYFLAQVPLIVLFSLPAWALGNSPAPLAGWDWAGIAVSLVALMGERAADRQLAAHRADPGNRGRTCRTGLWSYSRHPNYFFEWLYWCGLAAMALGASHGWVGLLPPLLLYYLLRRVTGIPYTEMRAVARRGEDYRQYQRTTSAFFPWFPRDRKGVTP
ncbi:DUF1295 domain-containing protein [Candidatus Latescibacterota bacterium]